MAQPLGFKALKHESQKVDRLSALPDQILCHILSFLRTECAACTSVLSSRWRDLFISVPDIDLTVSKSWNVKSEEDRDRELSNLLNFGFRLILQRNNAPIRKFQLYVSPLVASIQSPIQALISAVLLRKVRDVDIYGQSDKASRLYPPGLFTCATLASLRMEIDVFGVGLIVPNSTSVCLPNLKILHLKLKKSSIDEDSFARLIEGCPVLEELFLKWTISEDVNKILHVARRSLKTLVINCSCYPYQGRGKYTLVVESNELEYMDCCVDGVLNFTLNVPNLMVFDYKGCYVGVNFSQNPMTIVRAKIALEYPVFLLRDQVSLFCDQQVFELINGLHCVKSLYLMSDTLKALNSSGQVLPTFVNLTSLVLDDNIYHNFDDTSLRIIISSLLESAPYLEVLVLPSVSNEVRNKFSVRRFGYFYRKAFPAGFIHHLKEIKIQIFNQQEYDFKLVEYFLKNGKSLKKMTLHRSQNTWMSWPEHYKKILSFKKCSEDCLIVFDP